MHNPRILLVDDVSGRQSIKEHLRTLDAELRECSTGEECLASLQERLDCIVIEYVLPDTDACEVIRKIRASGNDVPIIMITDRGNESVAISAIRIGADDYLQKSSISEDRFLQAVQVAIRSSRERAESRFFKSFYDQSPVGFYTASLEDGGVFHANASMIRIFGVHDVTDINLYSIIKPADQRRLKKAVSCNEVFNFESRCLIGTEERWLMITASLCEEMDCINGSVVDITHIKTLELKLERFQHTEICMMRDLIEDAKGRIETYSK